MHGTTAMATPPPPPRDPREIAAGISRSKNFPWFQPEIGNKLTPSFRELLESYSGIAPQNVVDHIYTIVSWLSLFSSPFEKNLGTSPLRDLMSFSAIKPGRYFPGLVLASSGSLASVFPSIPLTKPSSLA